MQMALESETTGKVQALRIIKSSRWISWTSQLLLNMLMLPLLRVRRQLIRSRTDSVILSLEDKSKAKAAAQDMFIATDCWCNAKA